MERSSLSEVRSFFEKPKPLNDFNAIRLGLASPEKIRSWSHGEVIKPEVYDRLGKEEREEIDAKIAKLQEELADVLRSIPALEREHRRRVEPHRLPRRTRQLRPRRAVVPHRLVQLLAISSTDHPLHDDRFRGQKGKLLLQQPGDHPANGGLAAPTLAHQSQGLAHLNRETDSIHGAHMLAGLARQPFPDGKIHLQVFDSQ